MDYNYFILVAILILITTRIHFVTSREWIMSSPSIESVDIYNESAVNISWQYSTLESDQSTILSSIIIYRLNTTDVFEINLVIDGKQRFNYTSAVFVKSDFFKSNEYYSIVLKYNTTYYDGVNKSFSMSSQKWDRLFKMANTSIPHEKIDYDITANSVVVSFLWPLEIPYVKLETNAQLNDMNTSLPIEILSNGTHLIKKYKFQNLLSETNYQLNTTFEKKYLSNTVVGESTERISRLIRTLPNSALSVLMKFSNEYTPHGYLLNHLLGNV